MSADFLAALARANTPVEFWLRDDDATMPSAALDRLLGMGVPMTLAVIPAHTGADLAQRLLNAAQVSVAVHGWAHVNHAGPGEKSQELGAHRPLAVVLDEVREGFARLSGLYPAQFCPVLVPPWNRIAPALVAGLPGMGFCALSVFGPEKAAALPEVNTHVDIIDWRGTRGGRTEAAVFADLARAVDRGGPVGVLSHHLVHDAQAWAVLERVLEMTRDHPRCRWVGLWDLVRRGAQPEEV
jgi:hypothetical protein